jgi:uncharacterized RDD family membrane protein YckC
MGSQDLTSSEGYQSAKPVATSIAQAQLASFWRRLGAYVVDGIVIGVVWGLLMAIAAAAQSGGVYFVLILLGIAFNFAYFGYLWSSRGQTLGYMALGLRLVRSDGTQVTLGRAIARMLLVSLSFSFGGLPALVSAFMIGMSDRKQALHDLVVDTLVVRA